MSENSVSENHLRFLGALYELTDREVDPYVEISQVCEKAGIPATEDEDGGEGQQTHGRYSDHSPATVRGRLVTSMTPAAMATP